MPAMFLGDIVDLLVDESQLSDLAQTEVRALLETIEHRRDVIEKARCEPQNLTVRERIDLAAIENAQARIRKIKYDSVFKPTFVDP